MNERTYQAILIISFWVAFTAILVWWYYRKAFKAQCRKRATLRFLKKTGWEPLEAINYKLWLAYRRQEFYE